MDENYQPDDMETRTLFGMQMQQKRNDSVIDKSLFNNVATKNQEVCVLLLYSMKNLIDFLT